MVKMRYDMFICFLIAGLLALAINAVGDKYIDAKTAEQEEEKIISADEIGGQADDTIPIAKSIDDMKSMDRFTVKIDADADDDGSIYADKHLWRIVPLESGEYILADVYYPSVQFFENEEDAWKSDELYPVGELVQKELTQEMLDDVKEEGYELTVTDCYVDMANGNNDKIDSDFVELVTNILMIVVPIIAFILLHILGVKLGLFPPIFAKKQQDS